jgi:hypothetical protein
MRRYIVDCETVFPFSPDYFTLLFLNRRDTLRQGGTERIAIRPKSKGSYFGPDLTGTLNIDSSCP